MGVSLRLLWSHTYCPGKLIGTINKVQLNRHGKIFHNVKKYNFFKTNQ